MPHSQDAFQSLEAQGHFSSARFRGHKSDVWEGGHRVPFIVRWPGTVAAGSKSGQMVCQVDLMATFADIIGATLPAKAAEDSFSLLPLLKGSDKPVRETLVNHSINGRFAIREGSWKLALCPGSGGWSKAPEPPPGRKLPANQLYDLAKDAGERENLVAQHPEIVERLTKKLEMIVSDGRSTPGPKTANDVEVAILKKATEKSNSPAATKSEP